MADINHSTNNKVLNLIIIYHYFFLFHCGNHPEIICILCHQLSIDVLIWYCSPNLVVAHFFCTRLADYVWCVYEWHQHFYFYLVLFFHQLYTKTIPTHRSPLKCIIPVDIRCLSKNSLHSGPKYIHTHNVNLHK